MRIITCGRKVRGTCHADDLSYLFYNAAAKKLKRRTAEFKTIKRLVSMVVHFAISGDPNIPMVCQDEKEQPRGAWLPISKDDKVFQCLNISHDVHVIDLPEAEKLRLWDCIYDRELLY